MTQFSNANNDNARFSTGAYDRPFAVGRDPYKKQKTVAQKRKRN
jgi:hypothetical protein